MILAGNNDKQKNSGAREIRTDLTTDYEVSCP